MNVKSTFTNIIPIVGMMYMTTDRTCLTCVCRIYVLNCYSLHIKAVLIKKKIIQIHYKYSLIISPYRGIGIYHYYFLE